MVNHLWEIKGYCHWENNPELVAKTLYLKLFQNNSKKHQYDEAAKT